MERIVLFFVLILYLAVYPVCNGKSNNYGVTRESYDIHHTLESSLIANKSALFTLSELFFPREGSQPVCAPIQYAVTCSNNSHLNHSYLWTVYDSHSFVGQILLSSAFYGIILKGFDWENTCYFFHDTTPTLLSFEALNLTCSNPNNPTLLNEMKKFTAVLKNYASTGGALKGSDIDSNLGYVYKWNEGEEEDRVFRNIFIVFTILIIVLDFFIFFFSLGICSTVYDEIFKRVKQKKNPYYPLFWSFVLLTFLWDVGPSWFVLSSDMAHIRYSLGVMITVQFFLALFMRKYADFPIPGMSWKMVSWDKHRPSLITEDSLNDSITAPAPPKKTEPKYFFWEICHLRTRARIIVSFIVQTIALWMLLILFTFGVYYMVTIAISLYIYPIQTLIKVIFIKAIVLCAVFDVALLFSGSMWKWGCDKETNLKNLVTVAQVCAALSFLPILAFLAYVIGGVLFSDSINQLSGIQGVLAILPSVFLLLIGWYSKGTLFPEEILPNDPLPPVSSNTKGKAVQKSDQGHTPLLAHKVKAAMDSSSSVSYGAADYYHHGKVDPELSTGTKAV